MDYRLLVILGGIGAVALLWLLLRFGKHIARAVLALGILSVVIIGALVLLNQSRAIHQAVRVATVVVPGQVLSSVVMAFCIGSMGAMTLGALGIAGLFWVRWKLAERQRRLQRPRRQKALPQQEAPEIIIIEDEAEPFLLDDIDLSQWGWGG